MTRREFPDKVKVAAFQRADGHCEQCGVRPREFHAPKGSTVAQRHARLTDNSGGPDACWPWLGSLNRKGYGCFGSLLAHRVSYRTYKGPIPAGLYVLHNCDNRRCQNPAHLRVGTQADNMLDMYGRGRANIRIGSRHALAKLTEEQVREIRRSTASRAEMARRFNVDWSTINSVLKGETWGHVK